MRDVRMWALYFKKSNSLISVVNNDSSKTVPMMTDDVTMVGELKKQVLRIDPDCKFYVVKGTFIPEEKL